MWKASVIVNCRFDLGDDTHSPPPLQLIVEVEVSRRSLLEPETILLRGVAQKVRGLLEQVLDRLSFTARGSQRFTVAVDDLVHPPTPLRRVSLPVEPIVRGSSPVGSPVAVHARATMFACASFLVEHRAHVELDRLLAHVGSPTSEVGSLGCAGRLRERSRTRVSDRQASILSVPVGLQRLIDERSAAGRSTEGVVLLVRHPLRVRAPQTLQLEVLANRVIEQSHTPPTILLQSAPIGRVARGDTCPARYTVRPWLRDGPIAGL